MAKSMTRFARKVSHFFSSYLEQAQRDGVVCALSGGADSVALLCVLLELRIPVRALHCNFGLRGEESDRDEHFVLELCRSKGVAVEVKRFDTQGEAKATGESIEMVARRLRYAWFFEQDRPVAVAHHADDNVETFFLNLLRGCGLRGLTAMRIENQQGVLRPLLCVSRQEILAYLQQQAQAFVNDSSNEQTHYRRNALRHHLLPLLRKLYPSSDRILSENIVRLQAAEEIYQIGLDTLTHQWAPQQRADRLIYDCRLLGQRPQVAQTWLYEQLSSLGFDAASVSEMLTARSGALFYSSSHCATRTTDTLEIAPLKQERVPRLLLSESSRDATFVPSRVPEVVTIDADTIVGTLQLRKWQLGDRFSPYGMRRGSKLVSDYLTDRRRSRIDKERTWVVCDELGIVWLVGETIDRRVAVTATTQRILTLSLSS